MHPNTFEPRDAFPNSSYACKLAEISSHVNSSIRKILGARTPYQKALEILPKALLDALGIREVAPKDVIQKPNIFYKP